MEQNLDSKLVMKPKFDIVYKGKMFEVVQWEGKPGKIFEAAVRSPGVRLLIECEKDGTPALLMTKEIRREMSGFDYRLPGGKVFDTLDELNAVRESGESISEKAQAAGKKEGKEEAGIEGGTYREVLISKAGASVEWDLHYFTVTGAEIGIQESEEERGEIESVIKLTAQEIFEKLVAGEIQEGRSADVLWRWLAQKGYIQFMKN
ncbi:MAG TPA: hypothetical protein VGE63_03490 [Candidatus Paceibacterota bacterium]